MDTLTNGAVGAVKKSTKSTKSPKLALTKFRRSSSLTMECFRSRLLKQRGVHTPILNSTRVAIKITNPDTFFDLGEMLKDCLLRENAAHCPGQTGTVRHTMIGDNDELSLETSFPEDLWKLVFQHRLTDLDPEPSPAA